MCIEELQHKIPLPQNYRDERGHIMWPALIPWIIQEIKSGRSCTDIAGDVGTIRKTLAGMMVYYRDKGYDIPKSKKGPHRQRITERIAHGGGYHYHQKRVDGVWVTISRVEQYVSAEKRREQILSIRYKNRKVKIEKPKNLQQMSKPKGITKKEKERVQAEKKKAEKLLPTKVVDETAYTTVRVNSKTCIRIKKTEDVVEAVKKWNEKYNQSYR